MDITFNDNKTWEEIAASLPKAAADTDKLMAAICYHFEVENNETAEIGTIAKNYFRRARWSRPVNLSATANYCAGKGWLSEAGKAKTKKLWKITKRGYETVKARSIQI